MIGDCKVRLTDFEDYCDRLKKIVEDEEIDVE